MSLSQLRLTAMYIIVSTVLIIKVVPYVLRAGAKLVVFVKLTDIVLKIVV